MVATASPSSSKSLPLSYADRAKNVKISTQPAQSLPNGNTSSSNNSAGPSKVADKATNSSPIVENSGPSINQAQFLHTPSSPSRSIRTHPLPVNKVDNSLSVSNSNPTPSVKPLSPVNVWDLRKEQMAQATLSSRASSMPNAQNHSHPNLNLDPKLTANSHTSHSSDVLLQDFSENDDPFVVRSRVHISAPTDDIESWPEVGSSTHSVSSQSGAGSREANEKAERNDSRKGMLCPITTWDIHLSLI
jgi:la-related protein 1